MTNMADNGRSAQMLCMDRVILHVDLDCFYASVEHVRLGIPRSTPLAVLQWQGLIAVNYAARARGIVRHHRLPDAKQQCPELLLVHVEVIGAAEGGGRSSGKVCLERYREASARVFEVFQRSASACEKGGLDEAHLDMTAQETEVQVEEVVDGKVAVDWEGEVARLQVEPDGIYEPSEECPGGKMVVLEGPLVPGNVYDRRLLAGAILARKLQSDVVRATGYTISVGVACNKLLAKVASGMNKPSRITVVPPRAVPGLMRELTLKKIRNLGGKLGEELQQMGCATAGDVQKVSVKELVARFGEKAGQYVWQAVRGYHDEPVQEKGDTKSMLAAKSFEATTNWKALRRWLGILSEELAVRMLKDRHKRNRRPRTLQLYYRGAAVGDRSKSQPLPFQAVHLLSQPASTRPPKKDAGGSAAHDFDNNDAGGEGPGLDLVGQLGEAGGGGEGGEGGDGDGVVGPTVLSLAAVLEGAAFSMLEKAEGGLPCSRLALAASDFQDMQVQGTQSMEHFFKPRQHPNLGTASLGEAEKDTNDPPATVRRRTGILRFLPPVSNVAAAVHTQSALTATAGEADAKASALVGGRGVASGTGSGHDCGPESRVGDVKFCEYHKEGAERPRLANDVETGKGHGGVVDNGVINVEGDGPLLRSFVGLGKDIEQDHAQVISSTTSELERKIEFDEKLTDLGCRLEENPMGRDVENRRTQERDEARPSLGEGGVESGAIRVDGWERESDTTDLVSLESVDIKEQMQILDAINAKREVVSKQGRDFGAKRAKLGRKELRGKSVGDSQKHILSFFKSRE